jgi:hypothetical protein
LIFPRYPKPFARSVSSLATLNYLLNYGFLNRSSNALIKNVTGGKFGPFSQLSLRALGITEMLIQYQLCPRQIYKVNEAKVNEAKTNLNPFPDSKKGLEKLEAKRNHAIIAILGNG